MRWGAATAAVLGALLLAACGSETASTAAGGDSKTVTVERRVTVEQPATPPAFGGRPGLNAEAIYRRASPGVVTVISIFRDSGLGSILGAGQKQEGLGSGFVIDRNGEIATNAHVVTNTQARSLERARQVFVQFADGNQVPARIIGADPNVDVALIRVSPRGLDLRPLPLGTSRGVIVGAPVAAIGSPFNEPQSLSVGVVSGLNRSIDALTGNFKISGAIQTDAAINHGNSGGPLLDTAGRVLGINAQIESTGGGGEGVGFAVPVDAAARSLDQLRRTGRAAYAFLGVTTSPLYPQLAEHFGLPTRHGAWVQDVTTGGPAEKAGIKAGTANARFQTVAYRTGGDVIVSVDGHPLRRNDDLSEVIAMHAPGDTVTLELYVGNTRKTVKVKLGARPAGG